jgi:NAD(P)-dependent dehydrogenase (short-subunit alcohol dehydrogenase family)
MKTVLITGTSKGIGLETAIGFGRAGYKVFATMRHPEMAHDFKEVVAKESLDITISKMDVDSTESVKLCIEEILDEIGTLDILVNNAGIEHHCSVEELSMSDFKAIMETNYFGAIRCIKAVMPQMRKNKKGCIINVASVAGKISNSPLGAYAASKFALEAISEALAQEVKPFNIRVAIVEPGIINTQMANDISVDGNSIYPHSKRFAGLFAASLKNPTHPSMVANRILDIADSQTWQLRHPVGPDAEPFLEWRASMTDEEWVNWNAANDKDWYEAVENTFGLDARQKEHPIKQ